MKKTNNFFSINIELQHDIQSLRSLFKMIRHANIKNMHRIWHNQQTGCTLFLGDSQAATNTIKLRQSNISAVLTIAASLNIDHSENDITHKVINACDMPSYNMARHFDEAFSWIEEQLQDKNILVHCAAGISRSSTIVIMYLMRKNGWELKKSLAYVKGKRTVVCPNFGFIKQLERLERAVNLGRAREKQTDMSGSVKRYLKGKSKQNNLKIKENVEIITFQKSQSISKEPVKVKDLSLATRQFQQIGQSNCKTHSNRTISMKKYCLKDKRTSHSTWKQSSKLSYSRTSSFNMLRQ